MDRDQSAQLRKPFPPDAIGKIPKGGVELDYVGHAVVTDRLLEVDPEWTWEPAGVSEHGLPQFDAANGLWIKLTILGVTRYGYGDGKNPKECISDAIRNAAMRAGVGLSLWAKEELESSSTGGSSEPSRQRIPGAGESPAPVEAVSEDGGVTGEQAPPSSESHDLFRQFEALCKEAEVKPMATFVKVTGSTATWRQLQAGDVPVADIEKAIAAVAEVLLRKADG